MKKALPIVIVVIVAVVLFLVLRGGEEEPAVVETAEEVVAKIFAPQPAPAKPAEVSVVEFEVVEVWEEVEETETEAEPEARQVPGARIGAEQVLAVVNGRPLTGAQVIPPGRFKNRESLVVPAEMLKETIERAITRELVFQEAEAQGVGVGERGEAKLGAMYEHMLGNPLKLPEGQTIKDLNVLGDEADAAFSVRNRAAVILQEEFLKQSGQPNTAETRLAFREGLRNAADIEIVNLAPPEEPGE